MSSSEQDIFSNFDSLDDLIQLIYQGAHKFVLLSSVDQTSWTIHLGLTGPEGRWWRGRWTEGDVYEFVGKNISSFILESFAEKLAQSIVQSEICVGDWTPERGAKINLTFGPTAKTPIRVPLTELTSEEAAAYAAKVFSEIALVAQSRKCRLAPSDDVGSAGAEYRRPSPVPTSSKRPLESPPSKASKRRELIKETTFVETEPSQKGKESLKRESTIAEVEANKRIKELETQLAREKTKTSTSLAQNAIAGLTTNNAKKVPAIRRRKGASLANPNRAARKYQELEFESD